MSTKYKLITDTTGKWINRPNNGGGIWDLADIVAELNDLVEKLDYSQQERYKMDKEIRALSVALGRESNYNYRLD
jgi:hypothetical protein